MSVASVSRIIMAAAKPFLKLGTSGTSTSATESEPKVEEIWTLSDVGASTVHLSAAPPRSSASSAQAFAPLTVENLERHNWHIDQVEDSEGSSRDDEDDHCDALVLTEENLQRFLQMQVEEEQPYFRTMVVWDDDADCELFCLTEENLFLHNLSDGC
eukprot:CAMPEP_0203901670 /NCGR_PEP_ID=MMETSP0359-20131031/43800_1 /ASSEMBLY_ACC=CAM_ASM_000338 /TAXON_ID=268821 /ORGANISM="Scrippsiella Hangoei, Strain SHTV-5" /LENGTH=156 /DNA_ID=CAMNT_0050825367 /DNA_START=18 /DNA_END=488 /DNA_ORIENTATION=+